MTDSRTTAYAMHMYGDEAYKLVSNAISILRENGHDIILDDGFRRGFGSMDIKEDSSIVYRIGVKEIKEHPNTRFLIHEAISPVVTCFHEVCGHGGQWRHEAYKDTPLSKVLLMNDLACRNSWEFYGLDESGQPTRRYFEQPHEIAAQYMAVKMSEKYLSAVYGEEKASKMMTEYVNIRMAAGNEYIEMPENVKLTEGTDYRGPFQMPTEPYKDVPAVLDDYKETFVQKVFETPEYKVPKGSRDFVGRYIDECRWPWERGTYRKQVSEIPDRLTKAYVAASAWLNEKKEYSWIKDRPCFEDVIFYGKVSDTLNVEVKQPDKSQLDLDELTEDDIEFTKAVTGISQRDGPYL